MEQTTNTPIIREPDFICRIQVDIIKAYEALKSTLFESTIKHKYKIKIDYGHNDNTEDIDDVKTATSKWLTTYTNYIELANNNNGFLEEHYWKTNGRLQMKTKVGDTENYLTAVRMLRQFRSAIFSSNYTDIDIESCYPRILKFLYTKNELESPHLDKYLAEKHLDKMSILKIIGGSTQITPAYFDFYNEFKTNYRKFTTKAELPLTLQHYECVIIQYAIKFMTDNNFEIGAYMYDGLLIKNNPNIISIIPELNKYISEQTNINVNFKIKEFEKSFMTPEYDFKISARDVYLYRSQKYIELAKNNSITNTDLLQKLCEKIAFVIGDIKDIVTIKEILLFCNNLSVNECLTNNGSTIVEPTIVEPTIVDNLIVKPIIVDNLIVDNSIVNNSTSINTDYQINNNHTEIIIRNDKNIKSIDVDTNSIIIVKNNITIKLHHN